MKNRTTFEIFVAAAESLRQLRLAMARLSCNDMSSTNEILGIREWTLQEIETTKLDALEIEDYDLVSKLQIEIDSRESWLEDIIEQSK